MPRSARIYSGAAQAAALADCGVVCPPLPFYSLVRTRGPGTWDDPNKPVGLGAVLGRAQGPSGWEYAVIIGETTYSFAHDELEPLGVVLDRSVFFEDE